MLRACDLLQGMDSQVGRGGGGEGRREGGREGGFDLLSERVIYYKGWTAR